MGILATMRVAVPCSLVSLGVVGGTALAAKATRFWNLTDNTITMFELAPTGSGKFGPDQAKNDPDGGVDHDERMKIVGVGTGTFDARLSDSRGRTCIVRNVAVKDGEVFSIEEKQLTDCNR